jgi:hypothetical protein
LSCNYFGKSPYNDPIFTGMYLDNFHIFASALTLDQAKLLNSKKGTSNTTTGIKMETSNYSSNVVYDISGRIVSKANETVRSGLRQGLYIQNGKKFLIQ